MAISANEKRRRVLLMYLDFARKELEIGRALPRSFVDAIETWGKGRYEEIDRLNAIGLMPVVEKDGYHGDARFAELAKRLGRYRGNEPDERLARTWWESRHKTRKRLLRAIDGTPVRDEQTKELVYVEERPYRAHMAAEGDEGSGPMDDVLNRKPGRPKKARSKK